MQTADSSVLPRICMSRFTNNALLGDGFSVRVGIREQRKNKRRSKTFDGNPGHLSSQETETVLRRL